MREEAKGDIILEVLLIKMAIIYNFNITIKRKI